MEDQPYHPTPEEVAGFVKTFARMGEYCVDRDMEYVSHMIMVHPGDASVASRR